MTGNEPAQTVDRGKAEGQKDTRLRRGHEGGKAVMDYRRIGANEEIFFLRRLLAFNIVFNLGQKYFLKTL